MSRWIDTDALIRYGKRGTLVYWEDIENAPSIDIVFCPDCEYCKEHGGHANCNGYLYCTKRKSIVDEDNYCSWGKRK